jgi:hypothetical protein
MSLVANVIVISVPFKSAGGETGCVPADADGQNCLVFKISSDLASPPRKSWPRALLADRNFLS